MRPEPAISDHLAAACHGSAERSAWLVNLPVVLNELRNRWSLAPGEPLTGEEAKCAWVEPVVRRDGQPAVLKLGLPHMEAEQEIDALRFWAGDPSVFLYETDSCLNAMLLERCEPGSTLRARPEEEQDEVIARLLRRIWRIPPDPHPFRPLAEMTAHWIAEAMEDNPDSWPDAGLVREGLRIFEELPRTASRSVLLATDLHAGNVRAARREPWLIIDPKPFFGEPAYDATQHLMNCERRMRASPVDTVNRFADLLELDRERVKLWAFARCAFDSRDDDAHTLAIARMLRPD